MKNKPARYFSQAFTVLFVAILLLGIFAYVLKLINTNRDEQQWRSVPLPELSAQAIQLKVAHVINDRFNALSDEQLQQVLQHTRQLAHQHFGVDIGFQLTATLSIDDYFNYLPEHVIQARQASIIHPLDISQNDIFLMRNAVYESMEVTESEAQSIIDYAKPYLLDAGGLNNLGGLAHAVIDTMVMRIKYWYQHSARDGRPVIDDSPYNEWVWWDSMGYGDLPFEIVITNQLVASLENYDQELHSALRGGITGGTTTYSRNSPYQTYAVVSTFPVLSEDEMLAQLKDDESYSAEQKINYIAATLTHELGHMLFHYGHPFGVASCIMNPTPVLKYRQWYESLDAEKCRATSHPQMQAGAASGRIIYNPVW